MLRKFLALGDLGTVLLVESVATVHIAITEPGERDAVRTFTTNSIVQSTVRRTDGPLSILRTDRGGRVTIVLVTSIWTVLNSIAPVVQINDRSAACTADGIVSTSKNTEARMTREDNWGE